MALKIKPEHYDRLAKLIASDLVDIYRRAQLAHYQKLEQTPGTRFYQRPENWHGLYRWDVFNFICTHTSGLSSELYAYLNDDNIDAALRRLLPVE